MPSEPSSERNPSGAPDRRQESDLIPAIQESLHRVGNRFGSLLLKCQRLQMMVDDPSTRDELGVVVELVLEATKELNLMRELVRVEPEESEESPAPQRDPRGAVGARVLVVDDEETIREVLSDLLEGAGCLVDVAGTAEQGLDLCRSTDYTVVFADYDLGTSKGVDVTDWIKAESPSTRTVLMTGWDMARERPDSVDYVLCKPFRMREVLGYLSTDEGGAP